MLSQYLNNWQLFILFFGLMLLASFIMIMQSQNFYTFYVTKRKFSIMELEIPATYAGLVRIIKGLFILPEHESKRSVASLKGQLWLDFLFMPLAYGSIFLLCWRVSAKFQSSFGQDVFLVFAVLQIIPWVCDIIENIYLLGKIKEGINIDDSKESLQKKENQHKAYLVMEAFKWGIALTATTCAISAICYFWLTGSYSLQSLSYLGIVLIEIVVFLIVMSVSKAKKSIKQPISKTFDERPRKNTMPSPSNEVPATKGKILYDIPDAMKLNEQQKCLVRIAKHIKKNKNSFSEAVKIEDITLYGIMKVELIDIAEPPCFSIKTISTEEQLIDDDSYTEWLFWVTPLITGSYELILKVSGFKMIDGKERRKDILFEKVINIYASEEVTDENNKSVVASSSGKQKELKDLTIEKNKVLVDSPFVFLCYAHKDKTYFKIFLENLKSHSGWNIWTDRNIKIGSKWFSQIQDSMKQSDFAVLLVSSNFISSKFIKEEEFKSFKQLENSKENFTFWPVLLRDVNFERWNDLEVRQFFVAYGNEYGVPEKADEMIPFAKLCQFDKYGSLIPNDNIDTYFKNFVDKIRNDWLKKNRHIMATHKK